MQLLAGFLGLSGFVASGEAQEGAKVFFLLETFEKGRCMSHIPKKPEKSQNIPFMILNVWRDLTRFNIFMYTWPAKHI